MKLITTTEAKDHFTAIARQVTRRREPVVVTFHGTPRVVIEPMTEDDLEDLAFQYSPEVRRMVREANADIRAGRYVTHAEFLAGKRSRR